MVDSDARLQRYVRNVLDVAWQLIDSLKDGDAKPTTLILDGAINLASNLIAEDGSIGMRITQGLSRKNCAIVSRKHWSPLRQISVGSLLLRIIVILTLVL